MKGERNYASGFDDELSKSELAVPLPPNLSLEPSTMLNCVISFVSVLPESFTSAPWIKAMTVFTMLASASRIPLS